MARKAPSRRASAPRLAFAPIYSRSRSAKPPPVTAPEPESETGLLQLTFGRHAHGYGIAGAVALLANAILLFNLASLPFLAFRAGYPDDILLLLPGAIGAVVSWDAMRLKRGPYKGHYRSRHFVMSGIGTILFFLLAGVIMFTLMGFLPTGIQAWLYPIAVTGVSATIVSMAMTLKGLSGRKAGSIVLAAVLPTLMVLLVFSGHTIATPEGRFLYLLAFLMGAVMTEISGSLLHIIASSTSVYQREILVADNTKLGLVQQEYQRKREALDYKERALRGREAHLEALQQELDAQAGEIRAKQSDLAAREAAVERALKDQQDLNQKSAAARAEIEAKVEEVKLREAEIAAARAEIEKARESAAAREKEVAAREKETKRLAIEVSSHARTLEAKAKATEEQESRVQAAEKANSEKRAALLKLEKDLELRESELKLKMERAEATHSKAESTRIQELKDWEKKLLAKEKEIGKKEVEMRTMEGQLRERYENAARIERRFQEQRKIFEDREAELVAREKELSDREEAIEDRVKTFERQSAAVREEKDQVGERAKKYSELLKEMKKREAAAGSSEEEINRRIASLDARERKLSEMQSNLQSEIKRLNEQNRALLERSKELEERESQVHVREIEMQQAAKEARGTSGPGMRDMDREAQLEAWEKRLREREEELKRRTYQKEKEIEMREGAVKAHLTAGVTEAEAVAAVEIEKKAERVKTGTARLDDLLYGGIPFNSNVLFVGPAFVGKEVAVLNFIAEGLRKGVPAAIITTTKPPIDVARDMAPILPTFVEYEQLGLVRWIDCTSTLSSSKPTREKNVWRVNGPTDFDNIFNLVHTFDEEFRTKYPYFRLAFLTLSSCITQADEREALAFFQKLVNRLRQTKAVSAVALERGMHADQTLEALEHMVEGAIHFKTDKQKTFIHVAGLGDVQTREWIPYKFTNKALMIGSFQLERIR